ncbi:MAG: hypothetical protein IKN74_03275 [Clostridia bacterium]|nr:hypothetical protein [Clostridia bacterium]
MELKKCVRCGKFFASDSEVCGECERKDVVDLNKLKGFFLEGYSAGVTMGDISASTGITPKNLTRYLSYEEFSEYFIPQTASRLTESGNEDVDNSKVSL